MDITRMADRKTQRANPSYFSGDVSMEPVINTVAPSRVRAVNVTFQPGARTNWHTHPLGQTIFITAGVGRVQNEGGPVREVRAGDVVFFEPGERHWHGAAPGHAMTHVAMQEALDGVHIDWNEPVSDADYSAPATPV